MNSVIKKVICVFAIFFASSSVWAEEARQTLENYLNGLETLQADFQQSITSEQRGVQDVSTGTFTLSRPGKFLWEYHAPYEQTIIADGEKIWVYDKDLDQVTVRNMQQALADSPALLLSENVSISDQFNVTKTTQGDQREWFSLEPKSTDNQYVGIELAFLQGVISEMKLQDAFGQLTRIVFTNQQQNSPVDEQVFDFVPPEGVDVLDAEAE